VDKRQVNAVTGLIFTAARDNAASAENGTCCPRKRKRGPGVFCPSNRR